MASATETALLALYALLGALAAPTPPAIAVIPAPLRNEDLAARLAEIGSADVQSYLNLWDGGQNSREEYLGDDGGMIVHEARLELVVAGGSDNAARETAFDAALMAIFDALKANRTLGNVVDFADIGNLQGPGTGLVTDGIPHAKGVVIPVVLTFRSSRPF
jgi:hypothetical protein